MPETQNTSTTTDSATDVLESSKPAPTPAAPSPLVFPPTPQDSRLVVLREVTTTVIAMVILAVSIYMMLKTFAGAGGNFEQMKDIMLYALPILGTVMGYYFGRVPAERRAEASEKESQQAQVTAQNATAQALQTQQQAEQKTQQVKLAMERVRAQVASSSEGEAPAGEERSELLGATRGGSSGEAARSGTNKAAILAELDAIRRML